MILFPNLTKKILRDFKLKWKIKERPKIEIKSSEVRLHVGKLLGTAQCLSKRLEPRFDFNFKHHYLKKQISIFGIWHLVLNENRYYACAIKGNKSILR